MASAQVSAIAVRLVLVLGETVNFMVSFCGEGDALLDFVCRGDKRQNPP
ncbi:Hypothetical protein Cul210932_1864 [Corynebacterium ulcerans]|nr:Hypothetical protein Cul210932_1864 [Corynebacterium ulcerans]